MALMFAICSPQPNWMPKKPNDMFSSAKKPRRGLSVTGSLRAPCEPAGRPAFSRLSGQGESAAPRRGVRSVPLERAAAELAQAAVRSLDAVRHLQLARVE